MLERTLDDEPTTGPEAAAGTGPVPHRADTRERGSFCYAQCSCGWRGPARRARDRARLDAGTHTEQAGPGGPGDDSSVPPPGGPAGAH
ncbi:MULTISPECIES: hypothetical protein [Streptomyces]|uniref:Uncharacterized protein n=1 Tax=Streptomyces cacaoi TaxID=1898 RepID=A0A4Y3R3I4_STRCI|nr:hypothetical protein [Streptomyces cacaoi]QHF97820.1 hypothetical protein DEH18_32660 [Streptomyces sp. NHF165]GEB51467.1 hypothetical protein SCA03_40180 [Streptomyces cacaoi]